MLDDSKLYYSMYFRLVSLTDNIGRSHKNYLNTYCRDRMRREYWDTKNNADRLSCQIQIF